MDPATRLENLAAVGTVQTTVLEKRLSTRLSALQCLAGFFQKHQFFLVSRLVPTHPKKHDILFQKRSKNRL